MISWGILSFGKIIFAVNFVRVASLIKTLSISRNCRMCFVELKNSPKPKTILLCYEVLNLFK